MEKRSYEDRECVICGEVFTPMRANIKTCSNPECKRKWKLKQQRDWYRENYSSALESRRERAKMVREAEVEISEPHVRKEDTIVAIGYAERQMEQTLKMVGKVRTEL
ncbi:MAG: hypothetical protein IIY21_22180 [Clostridiales bacterium]|nr:hypothetical protein [Clostridiales bacterium]